MCDYSLNGVPNRLAVEGDDLVTHRFPTGTIGLASSAEIAARLCPRPEEQRPRTSLWEAFKRWLAAEEPNPVCAVCIPPGAKLRMSRIPDGLKREFGLNAVEEVTFTQLNADAYHYRDAIRFRSGGQLLLQSFREGVLFEVLSGVSSEQPAASPASAQEREQAIHVRE